MKNIRRLMRLMILWDRVERGRRSTRSRIPAAPARGHKTYPYLLRSQILKNQRETYLRAPIPLSEFVHGGAMRTELTQPRKMLVFLLVF